MKNLEKAIAESKTMREAAHKLGLPFSTFKRQAKKAGLYNPNQSGKGIIKSKLTLEDILIKGDKKVKGLRVRLIKEGVFEDICNECGLTEWNGKPITLELHHNNGDNTDNRIENLSILCPNCHAQTPSFRKPNYAPVAE